MPTIRIDDEPFRRDHLHGRVVASFAAHAHGAFDEIERETLAFGSPGQIEPCARDLDRIGPSAQVPACVVAVLHPNLVQHDARYPTPEYIRQQSHLGNVADEGDMAEPTPGSQHIVSVLLDATDDRPVWLQAWGGTNTIARALKTIEDDHPERMAEVANKLRFYFIWEQDSTYQDYIRPNWGQYQIPTIISDQFITFGYWYEDWDSPDEMGQYFDAAWMTENLLEDHGPLLALYQAQDDGSFRSEGDSPAFLHAIPTGLRSVESPDWGGWGGRYVRVRDNTWLDPACRSRATSIQTGAGTRAPPGGEKACGMARLPRKSCGSISGRCGDGSMCSRTILRLGRTGA